VNPYGEWEPPTAAGQAGMEDIENTSQVASNASMMTDRFLANTLGKQFVLDRESLKFYVARTQDRLNKFSAAMSGNSSEGLGDLRLIPHIEQQAVSLVDAYDKLLSIYDQALQILKSKMAAISNNAGTQVGGLHPDQMAEFQVGIPALAAERQTYQIQRDIWANKAQTLVHTMQMQAQKVLVSDPLEQQANALESAYGGSYGARAALAGSQMKEAEHLFNAADSLNGVDSGVGAVQRAQLQTKALAKYNEALQQLYKSQAGSTIPANDVPGIIGV
jgi:hypothetical protein